MEMHDLEDTVLVTSDLLFIKQVSYEEMNQRNLFVFIDIEQYFLFNHGQLISYLPGTCIEMLLFIYFIFR